MKGRSESSGLGGAGESAFLTSSQVGLPDGERERKKLACPVNFEFPLFYLATLLPGEVNACWCVDRTLSGKSVHHQNIKIG